MILFFDFHQSSVKSNNLKDMILFYDFISRRFHHISRNHDLWYFNPRCLGKQDIGAFCCSSLVIRDYTCNIEEKCTGVLHPIPQRILKTNFFSSYSQSKWKEVLGTSWNLFSNIGWKFQLFYFFIIFFKVNVVFEYSNNDDRNFRHFFKQFQEQSVTLLMSGKNALTSM